MSQANHGTVTEEENESGADTAENNSREGPNSLDSEAASPTDDIPETEGGVTYTPRFAGLIIFFGVLTGVGILTFNSVGVAAAAVLLVFLIAGIIQTPTAPGSALTVSYHVTPEHPRPAEQVTVEATVTNDSDKTFPDIRLIDTVPDGLRVIDGSPRLAGSLRPGQTATISYTVIAQRDSYTFGPLIARTRSAIGSMWVQDEIHPDDETRFECAVNADEIPLEERGTHYIGGLLGSTGGDGIEFHSTREYQRGDSPSRINWRELAKRGELSTITYREQQAAEVTLICDARDAAYTSAGNGTPSAASLSTYAAYQLTASLVSQGHYVGVAVPGLEPDIETTTGESSAFPYRRVEHGRDSKQEQQVFELIDAVEKELEDGNVDGERGESLEVASEWSVENPDGNVPMDSTTARRVSTTDFATAVTAWASRTTQFMFITPLLDNAAFKLCNELAGMGFSPVVISPDATQATGAASRPSKGTQNKSASEVSRRDDPHATVSARIASLQRATRIEKLRQNGLTVIDWNPNTPLSVACEKQTLPGV